jgi:two-component system, OmpR family, sensor kinase
VIRPVRRLSASARRTAGRARQFSARTPLRVRLAAALSALVVLGLVSAGVAATATMRAYLVGRVDAQLEAVTRHPVSALATSGAGRGKRADGDRLPSAYVLEVLDASGGVVYGPTSDLIDPREPLPQLPNPRVSGGGSAPSYNATVSAVSGSEQWRIAVRPATLSDGSAGTLLVAQSLGDVRSTVSRLMLLFAVVGGVAVLVIAGLGYLVVRASLRPLGEVERTAGAIGSGDLTRRAPSLDPRTEIGQLSAAFNTMLGEVEVAFTERAASEDRMRRFIADASHELRTPLTTIRGFAELYRQGAPADLPRLMRRIEDEAARLGLLVEDLLLLAHLDQQRPLARTPVDLLAVADDAVHDTRAVAPDRAVRLEVGHADPPPVVTGDEPRLRQLLSNLLGNAVRHTPRGTPITVRVATAADRGSVRLTVSDEGPGMTAEQAARAFERFYRVDPARGRVDGGSGLGLAIAAALVAGHGGTIGIETTPGHGASVRVELPLAMVPAVP